MIEVLDNLPALFEAEPFRVKVQVHAVPLQALAVIGRDALTGSATCVQFQKILIAPDAAAIFRRAGSFTADEHNLQVATVERTSSMM